MSLTIVNNKLYQNFFFLAMKLKSRNLCGSFALAALLCISQVMGDGFRLPDQQPAQQQQATIAPQSNIFGQQQTATSSIPQQQQQQPQQTPAGIGEERGRSSILSLFGLGNDNDPYLAKSNSNCLSGDLSECFKTQALNSFEEIFYRDQYR